MDRLKQIESFVSVAAKGSLTAAAQAEGVAPAVVGRRIDALEERLGVKLLLRTTRRISLTHEGSAFLEDCQRILADMDVVTREEFEAVREMAIMAREENDRLAARLAALEGAAKP